MRIIEVLESVKRGELTKLEKLDFIKDITEEYDQDRIDLLRAEVKTAIFRIKKEHETDPEILFKGAFPVIQKLYNDKSIEELKVIIIDFLKNLPEDSRPKGVNIESIFNSWRSKGINFSEKEEVQSLQFMLLLCFVWKEHGENVMNSLLDIFELKQFDELIAQKSNKKRKVKNSNNAKLPDADEWIVPIIKEIMSLEIPTHNEVLSIFEDSYPGFVLEFGRKRFNQLRLAKGMVINRTSIAKVIKFIFERKNPGVTIGVRSITSRYRKEGHW
jgi:hypothetical protein